jgi:hypothetical protein
MRKYRYLKTEMNSFRRYFLRRAIIINLNFQHSLDQDLQEASFDR